jgi:hypothetical protein
MPQIEGYWTNEVRPVPRSETVGEDFLIALRKVQSVAPKKWQKGSSYCRLCRCDNGSAEYRFKGWIWPEGFEHYLTDHNVHPSEEFRKFIDSASVGITTSTKPFQIEPGSAWLQQVVIDKILEIVPAGGKILEFGSGYSTRCFARSGRKVFSIESDPRWVVDAPNVTTLLIPIVGRWYGVEQVRMAIANLDYDAILIDGPKGYGATDRLGVLSVIDLFLNVPIFVDDAHRAKESWIAAALGCDRRVGRAAIRSKDQATASHIPNRQAHRHN